MYRQVVNAVKELQWKAVIKDNIIICEFCILYFDDIKNVIYVSPNMGDNYDREITFLYKLLASVTKDVSIIQLGYHLYLDGRIIWNTSKDFIPALKDILEFKVGNRRSVVTKLVIERKYGAPLELSKPNGDVIKPMFG
jgi:hypothetical protein